MRICPFCRGCCPCNAATVMAGLVDDCPGDVQILGVTPGAHCAPLPLQPPPPPQATTVFFFNTLILPRIVAHCLWPPNGDISYSCGAALNPPWGRGPTRSVAFFLAPTIHIFSFSTILRADAGSQLDAGCRLLAANKYVPAPSQSRPLSCSHGTQVNIVPWDTRCLRIHKKMVRRSQNDAIIKSHRNDSNGLSKGSGNPTRRKGTGPSGRHPLPRPSFHHRCETSRALGQHWSARLRDVRHRLAALRREEAEAAAHVAALEAVVRQQQAERKRCVRMCACLFGCRCVFTCALHVHVLSCMCDFVGLCAPMYFVSITLFSFLPVSFFVPVRQQGEFEGGATDLGKGYGPRVNIPALPCCAAPMRSP